MTADQVNRSTAGSGRCSGEQEDPRLQRSARQDPLTTRATLLKSSRIRSIHPRRLCRYRHFAPSTSPHLSTSSPLFPMPTPRSRRTQANDALAPKVVSFEEQDSALKLMLADSYEQNEDFTSSAKSCSKSPSTHHNATLPTTTRQRSGSASPAATSKKTTLQTPSPISTESRTSSTMFRTSPPNYNSSSRKPASPTLSATSSTPPTAT